MLKVIKPDSRITALLKAKLSKLFLIFVLSAFIFANAEMRHAKAANALLFSDFKTFLAQTLVPLLNNVGAVGLAQPVQLLLEMVPWLAVVVFVGLIIWAGVQGYKDIDQQEFGALGWTIGKALSGLGIILVIDKVSSYLVT